MTLRPCSLPIPDGRIALSDGKLIVTSNGEREETLLASEDEWKNVLLERFGIIL